MEKSEPEATASKRQVWNAGTPELGEGREVAFPYETSMFAYRAI